MTVDALAAVGTSPAPASEAEEGLTVDPHVWLDPARYEEIVRAVADALAKADPANEATYAANAEDVRRARSPRWTTSSGRVCRTASARRS